MKKTKMKCFLIILTLLLLLFSCTQVSADVLDNPDTYKPDTTNTNNSSFKNVANVVLGNISAIGTVVSVAALVGIGIKYLLGSVEEKAAYKKTMLPYLIGAILVFAGSQIVGTLYNYAITL